MNALAVALVAAPFASVPLLLLARGHPRARNALSVAVPLATFALALALWRSPGETISWRMADGLALSLAPDALGTMLALTASALWIPTSIFSIAYLRGHDERRGTYVACFSAVLAATMGVAMAGDLLTLVVFYEIISLSAYPLVVHHQTEDALAAGRKYLAYTLGGGAALVVAIGLARAGGASLTFASGGNASLAALPDAPLRALALLLVAGFAVKATLAPLHGWLPSAMVAPAPVSGLLHAVAVVAAGGFGLTRAFGWYLGDAVAQSTGAQWAAMAAALFTLVAASLFALVQDDLKLRLAYSTIAQMSVVATAAALAVPAGAVLHLSTHGAAKLALFLVAGALSASAARTRVSELDGLGRAMPLTFAAVTLAALSLAGLPLTGGFASKGTIEEQLASQGHPFVALLLVASSALTAAYLVPILWRAYARPAPQAVRDAEPMMVAPALACAALAIGLAVTSWGAPAVSVLVAIALPVAGALAWAAARRDPGRAAERAIRATRAAFSAMGRASVAGVRATTLAAGRLDTRDTAWTMSGLVLALFAIGAFLAWRLA